MKFKARYATIDKANGELGLFQAKDLKPFKSVKE